MGAKVRNRIAPAVSREGAVAEERVRVDAEPQNQVSVPEVDVNHRPAAVRGHVAFVERTVGHAGPERAGELQAHVLVRDEVQAVRDTHIDGGGVAEPLRGAAGAQDRADSLRRVGAQVGGELPVEPLAARAEPRIERELEASSTGARAILGRRDRGGGAEGETENET